MNALFVKIPKWVQRLFKNKTWSISTTDKEIYLTFDDGPTPKITEWVLNQLEQHNAKATFFCIGKNIKKHSDTFNKITANGHSIGNHTYNHLKGWNTPSDVYLENILKTERILERKSNSKKLFRPPYGKITAKQSIKIIDKGYKIIMWEVLSADFDSNINKEKCLKNVLKNAKSGSIIVFHDSIKASAHIQYVLPKVLEHFKKKGYRFKAIT
ncbi:polysaccharide deacetylase family protein [Flavicella sp.]|uniref:polysaccharide deacetylase family protein n=1 Tax=Flavicella sp. TaxID=2957742 RepID=UPI003017C948